MSIAAAIPMVNDDHELHLENAAMAALLALANGDIEGARNYRAVHAREIEAHWNSNKETMQCQQPA